MARLAEREMVAGNVAHRERPYRGRYFAVAQREPVGRVIGQRIGALLRLEQQRERRIAADVDPLDRIHLDGDVQAHGGMACWAEIVGCEAGQRSTQFSGGPATRSPRAVLQRVASNALTMWRGNFARRDQDDIEADRALRVCGMVREPELGGGDDALLVAFGDGFRRVVEACRAP